MNSKIDKTKNEPPLWFWLLLSPLILFFFVLDKICDKIFPKKWSYDNFKQLSIILSILIALLFFLPIKDFQFHEIEKYNDFIFYSLLFSVLMFIGLTASLIKRKFALASTIWWVWFTIIPSIILWWNLPNNIEKRYQEVYELMSNRYEYVKDGDEEGNKYDEHLVNNAKLKMALSKNSWLTYLNTHKNSKDSDTIFLSIFIYVFSLFGLINLYFLYSKRIVYYD